MLSLCIFAVQTIAARAAIPSGATTGLYDVKVEASDGDDQSTSVIETDEFTVADSTILT